MSPPDLVAGVTPPTPFLLGPPPPDAPPTDVVLAFPEPSEPANPDLAFVPVEVRARADGWTPDRQPAFVEELADCGIIREAPGRVGMSEESVTRLRRRPGAASFIAASEAALYIATRSLRSIAFERAVNGFTKRHYYHGELVSEERVFDNRLLIYLLGKCGTLGDPGGAIARYEGKWLGMIDAIHDSAADRAAAASGDDGQDVWRERGCLWTGFPGPEGFRGTQRGSFGGGDYCRTLSAPEVAAIEAIEERRGDSDHLRAARRRDRYFAFDADPSPG